MPKIVGRRQNYLVGIKLKFGIFSFPSNEFKFFGGKLYAVIILKTLLSITVEIKLSSNKCHASVVLERE